ncbi:hypothetical protein CR155_00670 [Pollutimonas nitritireducens]|uniref:Uncharacterized protein n=1 Tax=Pollutimonas nitritireducens TaxID=2045209 RepID=A0A2N4UKU5_9BURK|nr:hypothetical protein [Pollutimonas nitritireducens]PLC55605.1 hypothetical protein CR155_00670 [Pollutimonas nitritireducens]
MPDQSKTSHPKNPEADDSKNKVVPDPADDRPQREDEYLSKFLQDPSPESGKHEGGENKKEK